MINIKHVKLFEFKSIKCPQRGGIDFPCVICQGCEIGEVQSVFMNEVFIEKTVNSALLSINLELKDEFEELLLNRFLDKIGNETSFITKKPQDGFQVTFFVTSENVSSDADEEKVMKFIDGFQSMWSSLVSRARTYLNKWEREATQEVLRNLR